MNSLSTHDTLTVEPELKVILSQLVEHLMCTIFTIKLIFVNMLYTPSSWADPDGEHGVWTPTGESQKYRFLSNIGPASLKSHKIQFWAIIGTPRKRRLNGVSLTER